MSSPKVTVATVVFNDAANIENTLLSVLNQDGDLEYIVIDGNSSDGTTDVIRRYSDKIDVFISEPDHGIYDAMNKAIDKANGEWILFMNSGDCFYSNNSVRDMISDLEDCDVVYGDAMYFYDDYNELVRPKPVDYLKYEMPFNHQAVIVRTALMREYKFDLQYRYAADYNFFHLLYVHGAKFLYKPIIVAEYHLVGGKTFTNIRACYKEIAKISAVRGWRYYKSKIHVDLYYYFNKYFPSFLSSIHRIFRK